VTLVELVQQIKSFAVSQQLLRIVLQKKNNPLSTVCIFRRCRQEIWHGQLFPFKPTIEKQKALTGNRL